MYEDRGELENKRRSGRRTEFRLQIGTLASSVSSHLKFPFVSLQDKVSEKPHLYTAALQVNNKTCLLYYQKLQYFFQNSLFIFDAAKMELPPSRYRSKLVTCCGAKIRLCIQARATKYPPRKTTLVYSFICLFFFNIIFEKLILKLKSECNYKG